MPFTMPPLRLTPQCDVMSRAVTYLWLDFCHRVTGLKSKCLHPSCSLADVAPLFRPFEHVALPWRRRRWFYGARMSGASLARRRSDELD